MIDVVGIGAGGWDSLSPDERALVTSADRVFGSLRQLDLLPDRPDQQRTPWPSPLRPALAGLLGDHACAAVVVLASGDPLLAGLGTTLIELFGSAAVRVHPAVSSVALARAQMGWSAESTQVVRLSGPGADAIRRHLAPGRRLVVLSRDGDTPAEVVAVLVDSGFSASVVTVLCELGADQEGRETGTARGWTGDRFPGLNLVCVECVPDRASASWSSAPGLPDDLYEHDGQLTKRHVRAAALAHLMPVPGQLLWDVGAGAGSVAIEWLRSAYGARAVCVELDPARAERITRNAARLGVPDLVVITGAAPEALVGLASPDAVFVGGGASESVVELAWHALRGGGRLVVHAVTHESELLVSGWRRRWGGELSRLSVELMEPLGGYSGWKPARAVVQWSVQKPLIEP